MTVGIVFMTKKHKAEWINPEIKDLGKATDLIEGGEGGDPKFLGTGDQFAVNNLTT